MKEVEGVYKGFLEVDEVPMLNEGVERLFIKLILMNRLLS